MIRNSMSLNYEVDDHGTTSLINFDNQQVLDHESQMQEEGHNDGSKPITQISSTKGGRINEPFYFDSNNLGHLE